MTTKTALALLFVAGLTQTAMAEEINALVWCDHTDPALLDPFTAATGIKVNVKDYEGTAAGLAILDQSNPVTGTCWSSTPSMSAAWPTWAFWPNCRPTNWRPPTFPRTGDG